MTSTVQTSTDQPSTGWSTGTGTYRSTVLRLLTETGRRFYTVDGSHVRHQNGDAEGFVMVAVALPDLPAQDMADGAAKHGLWSLFDISASQEALWADPTRMLLGRFLGSGRSLTETEEERAASKAAHEKWRLRMLSLQLETTTSIEKARAAEQAHTPQSLLRREGRTGLHLAMQRLMLAAWWDDRTAEGMDPATAQTLLGLLLTPSTASRLTYDRHGVPHLSP